MNYACFITMFCLGSTILETGALHVPSSYIEVQTGKKFGCDCTKMAAFCKSPEADSDPCYGDCCLGGMSPPAEKIDWGSMPAPAPAWASAPAPANPLDELQKKQAHISYTPVPAPGADDFIKFQPFQHFGENLTPAEAEARAAAARERAIYGANGPPVMPAAGGAFPWDQPTEAPKSPAEQEDDAKWAAAKGVAGELGRTINGILGTAETHADGCKCGFTCDSRDDGSKCWGSCCGFKRLQCDCAWATTLTCRGSKRGHDGSGCSQKCCSEAVPKGEVLPGMTVGDTIADIGNLVGSIR